MGAKAGGGHSSELSTGGPGTVIASLALVRLARSVPRLA